MGQVKRAAMAGRLRAGGGRAAYREQVAAAVLQRTGVALGSEPADECVPLGILHQHGHTIEQAVAEVIGTRAVWADEL